MPRRTQAVRSVEEHSHAMFQAMSARAITSREASEILRVTLRTAQRYLLKLIEDGDVVRLGWTSKAVFAVRGSPAAERAAHLPTPVGREPAPEKPFQHIVVQAELRKPNTHAPRWIFDAHQKHLNRRRPV